MAILRWFSIALLCAVAVTLADEAPSILDICGQGIGLGYDVVNERFKFPLVAWHYDLAQTDTLNGVRYQIPDELFFARTPQLLSDSSFQVMKSTSQFIQSYISNTKFGASATLLKGKVKLDGALSKTKGDVTKLLNENNANFATVNNDFLTFRLNVYPLEEVSLHPRFKAALEKLPSDYNADAYMSFIESYGTHFFVDSQYGGRNNFTTSFDSKLFTKHDSQWVTDQLTFNLGVQMFKFNVSSTLTSNNTKVTSEFKQDSNTTHIVLGGDPTVFEGEGYQKWLPTIAKQHAIIPVRSQLAPISDLIKDATKKSSFDQAIIDYCNHPLYRPANAIVGV